MTRGAGRRLALAALLAATACAAVPGARAWAAIDGVVDLADGFDVRLDGGGAGDFAGAVVSAAGDVDDDGRPDVLVSARFADRNGRANSGSVFVLLDGQGRRTIDLDSPGVRGSWIDGAAAGDEAGSAGAAGVGDVNGDGVDDIAVGARGADNNGRSNSGSVYVVFGGVTADVDLANLAGRGFRIDGESGGDELSALPGPAGGPVAVAAHDVNGDGLGDLVVGAWRADHNGRTDSGSAYVVFGSASPSNLLLSSLGSRGFRIDGAAADDRAGVAVSPVGDANGDGRAEVVVGAYFADAAARSDSGAAFVVYGKASTGATTRPTRTATWGARRAPLAMTARAGRCAARSPRPGRRRRA